jgi:hypothetical protein
MTKVEEVSVEALPDQHVVVRVVDKGRFPNITLVYSATVGSMEMESAG